MMACLADVTFVPVLLQYLGWLPVLRLLCSAKGIVGPAAEAMVRQCLAEAGLPPAPPIFSLGTLVKLLWEAQIQSLMDHGRGNNPDHVEVRHFRNTEWIRRPGFLAAAGWRVVGFEDVENHLRRYGQHPLHWISVRHTEEATPGWTDFFLQKRHVLRLVLQGFEVELIHVEQILLYTEI